MEFRPHSYQRHCINKILETKKLGLFLDMGLGKTVTTLTAVKELKYNRFQVCKVLVLSLIHISSCSRLFLTTTAATPEIFVVLV